MNEQKQEQLKKVMQEHPEINEMIKELRADSQEEMQAKMIELLKEYGVELTAEDLKAPSGELSDDELEAVSGGGGCGCSGAGGGGGDYLICGCLVAGSGWMEGAGRMNEYGGCCCVGGGAGATNWGDEEPHPFN